MSRTIRLLYVEDNEDLRASIAMLLEDEPAYAITTCATGEEALALFEQGAPCDVLVTDVGLPGLSGIDLARQATARDPQQWVVLCSGYDLRGELAALGPNVRALVKPFEMSQLEDLLAQAAAALGGGPA